MNKQFNIDEIVNNNIEINIDKIVNNNDFIYGSCLLITSSLFKSSYLYTYITYIIFFPNMLSEKNFIYSL
jgi:hypothetical protein